MKQLLQQPWIRNSVLVLIGLILGWILFSGSETDTAATDEHQHTEMETSGEETVWTCSMHPQVRQSEPGNCPICGMELIPADSEEDDSAVSAQQVQMSETAAKIAEIQTTKVMWEPAIQQVRLPGKIAVDERRISSVTAHFPGRIKTLLVNYTGEYVEKGQILARIYSPELITAQKELLEALHYKENNPALYKAARRKLELWELPDEQIHAIEHNERVLTEVPIVSPVSGYVTQRRISREDHVMEGTIMYEIADLSKVWGIFEAYESDLSALSEGDSVTFQVDALRGKEYRTTISYIDPVLQTDTRTIRVRTEIDNAEGTLKPEMIAQAMVRAQLNEGQPLLQVPASAVMWTGERSLVYVRDTEASKPTFEAREVVLGTRLGERYVILDGLSEGEEVVTHGTFKLDSAAQLAGKTSMMNPSGKQDSSAQRSGHRHSEMSEQMDAYPESFSEQFRSQMDPYFQLKDALVASKPEDARRYAKALFESLSLVSMQALSETQHKAWMKSRTVLESQVQSIEQSSDLEEQREAFSEISMQLITLIKKAGITGVGYQQHCPMAFGNGADWLSQEEEVRNPYYGEQMLTCGSVVTEW
ncbi:MAG: efflux RND transporter periplasmic adaptor subunit [Bacteroidota bacterium]